MSMTDVIEFDTEKLDPDAVKMFKGSVGSKQKIQILFYNGRVEFIPVKPIREMRGFLEGIDTSVERESDRI